MKRKLPSRYEKFRKDFPAVMDAYEKLGKNCIGAGPLSKKECALVKLGIAVGAGHEGAVHAHTRRALEAGIKPSEIKHAVLMATTTIGFPRMMAALSWADDVLCECECECDSKK